MPLLALALVAAPGAAATTAGLNAAYAKCVQDSKKVDVLFVLDASRTVLEKHNGRTKLAQSLEFVTNTLGGLNVSEDEINVAVVAFSNVGAMVLAFNTTYNYTVIQETLAFPEVSRASWPRGLVASWPQARLSTAPPIASPSIHPFDA